MRDGVEPNCILCFNEGLELISIEDYDESLFCRPFESNDFCGGCPECLIKQYNHYGYTTALCYLDDTAMENLKREIENEKKNNYDEKTKVVNIKQDEYDVYIGRAGRGKDGYFGNPILRAVDESPGSTLDGYRAYFYNRLERDPEFKKRVLNLKGKRLGCFCKPAPCHGDVIKEWLDRYEH